MTGQDVLGRINPGGSPSLLLNGHVDVPPEAALWSSDPFVPVRSDGWLAGTGAAGNQALAAGAGTGMADAGPGAAG